MKRYIFNVDFYTVDNFYAHKMLYGTMRDVVIRDYSLNFALYGLASKISSTKNIQVEQDAIARPETRFAGEKLKQIILYGTDGKMPCCLIVHVGQVIELTASDEDENFGVKERFDTLENIKFTHPADEDNWQEGFMFEALHGANIKAYALPKDGAGIKTPLPYCRRLFAVQLDGKWIMMTYATDKNGEARWGCWLSHYILSDGIDESVWNVVETNAYAIVSHGGRKCSICCPDKKMRIDVSEHVDAATNPIRIFNKLNSYDSFSEK